MGTVTALTHRHRTASLNLVASHSTLSAQMAKSSSEHMSALRASPVRSAPTHACHVLQTAHCSAEWCPFSGFADGNFGTGCARFRWPLLRTPFWRRRPELPTTCAAEKSLISRAACPDKRLSRMQHINVSAPSPFAGLL